MKDAPAFDFYPERWLAGVTMFSDVEQIAYIRLLCHQWLNDGLVNDVKTLRRMAGKGVTDAILNKFPVREDGIRRNAMLESVRAKQRERINQASEAAKVRWNRKKEEKQDAGAMREQCGSMNSAHAQAMPCEHRVEHPLSTHPSPLSSSSEDKSSEEREAASRPVSRKKSTHPNPAQSKEECQRFAVEIGAHWRDGDAFWDTMEDSGWTKNQGKTPVLDWQKTMRKWVSSGWLPSAKGVLDWSEPPPWEANGRSPEDDALPEGPSDKDDIRASMAKAREENRRIESGECELELVSEE